MVRQSRWVEFGLPYMVGLTLMLALVALAVSSSLSSPAIEAQEQPTATPAPEGDEATATPTPEPVSLSVRAERGDDPTTASVSWSEYEGADFDYYRVVICDIEDFDMEGLSCGATAFVSAAHFDASETGPVAATGLDPYSDYVVVAQLWLAGASDPLRFYWGIVALEEPAPEATAVPASESESEPVARAASGREGRRAACSERGGRERRGWGYYRPAGRSVPGEGGALRRVSDCQLARRQGRDKLSRDLHVGRGR